MEFKFELSNRVSDPISGIDGIIVTRAQYLAGYNRYEVQPYPLETKDGMQIRETRWVDEALLSIVPVR